MSFSTNFGDRKDSVAMLGTTRRFVFVNRTGGEIILNLFFKGLALRRSTSRLVVLFRWSDRLVGNSLVRTATIIEVCNAACMLSGIIRRVSSLCLGIFGGEIVLVLAVSGSTASSL
jgi:hypothetical protein